MKILTVIPIYHPDKIEQLSAFINLLGKYSDVLCIFNDGNIISLGQRFSECPEINKGTSGAYNLAIKKYLNPYEYIWLWDQDSLADDELLNNFITKVMSFSHFDRCGIFSFFDTLNEVRSSDRICCILGHAKSSGTIIKKTTISQVGLFDETLFIDYVDYEYIRRSFAKGFYTIQISDLKLNSHIQGGEYKTIFGSIYAPSPSRLYYQKKGTLYIFKLEYIPLQQKLKLIFRLFAWIPFSLIFNDRLTRIKMMLEK